MIEQSARILYLLLCWMFNVKNTYVHTTKGQVTIRGISSTPELLEPACDHGLHCIVSSCENNNNDNKNLAKGVLAAIDNSTTPKTDSSGRVKKLPFVWSGIISAFVLRSIE